MVLHAPPPPPPVSAPAFPSRTCNPSDPVYVDVDNIVESTSGTSATTQLDPDASHANSCVTIANNIIDLRKDSGRNLRLYFFLQGKSSTHPHVVMTGRAVYPKNPDTEFGPAATYIDGDGDITIAGIIYKNTPDSNPHPFNISITDVESNKPFYIDPKIQNQPPDQKGGGPSPWWIAISVLALGFLAALASFFRSLSRGGL